MLNSVNKTTTLIKLIILLFALSCNETTYKRSKPLFDFNTVSSIYMNANDSIKSWCKYKLRYYNYDGVNYRYYLDSLVYMNNSKDRIITALQTQVSLKDATSDGLIYFYGEKINGLWYFFSGPSIIIPRKMVKNHPLNKPLSYQQLHQIALKEIYGGYLKFDGSINEDWFTSHFEGPGWGDFNDQKETMKYLELPEDCVFTDRRKFYEAIHLQGVRNMWYGVKKDITLKP